MNITYLDFESDAIQQRPKYPPKPCGIAIQRPGERKPTYHRWGHPFGNNISREAGLRLVRDEFREALRQRGPALCFQNGKFDVDVAEEHCEAPRLPWEKIHDTMFLIALKDPHAHTFSLKPSAQRLLGIAPEEQEELKRWIIANVPEARRKPSEFGAYISRAPGDLVGRYAGGDIFRTKKLFEYLLPDIDAAGMLPAYNRERQLMPILLDSERAGIRVDLARMERDYAMYEAALKKADDWLRKRLGNAEIDFDTPDTVAKALDKAGIITEWVMTKTGKKSTAKANMTLDMFNDPRVAQAYGYRQRLDTCLSMFFRPWLAMARATQQGQYGWIFTNWNQVRQTRGKDNVGARTGRLSSNPNFQNIPTDFDDKGDGYTHPKFLRVPDLPYMREYLLPDPGHYWIKRDYSQQEIRLLAHYEDGELMREYLANPKYDLHAAVKQGIFEIAGLDLPRGQVKILNFGDIYGMGFPSFHQKTRLSKNLYDQIKAAKKRLMPDLAQLEEDIKLMGKQGIPIRTWGGRLYYCEEPAYSKKFGRSMTFEYKLLNYLIQGSAADVTKEACIRYHNHPKRQARFLLTVHDEMNSSAPKARWKEEQRILGEVMESIETDVPMLSDPIQGRTWGTADEGNPATN